MKQDIIQKFKQDWDYTEDEECFTIKGDLVEPIVVDGFTLDGVNIHLPKHTVYRDYEVFNVEHINKNINYDIDSEIDSNENAEESYSKHISSNDEEKDGI